MEEYLKRAQAGDPLAQLRLGLGLILGLWGTPDPDEGFAWLRVSANQGNNLAAETLDFTGHAR